VPVAIEAKIDPEWAAQLDELRLRSGEALCVAEAFE
jgi:hypothetical protein